MFNSKFFLFGLFFFSSLVPTSMSSAQGFEIQIGSDGLVTINYPANDKETGSLAFEIGNQIKPKIKTTLSDLPGDNIRYQYQLENEADAKQKIANMRFLAKREFRFTPQTDTETLAAIFSYSVEDTVFRNSVDTLQKFFLPPPFSDEQRPLGWRKFGVSDIGSISGRFYDSGVMISTYAKRSQELRPGQSIEFSLTSDYLPGIAEVFFQGLVSRNVESPKTIFADLQRQIGEKIASIRHPLNSGVRQFALFPAPIYFDNPATDCDTFITDLIGQVREAAALGWIKYDLRKDDDKDGKGKGDDKGVKKGHDDGDDHVDDDVEMDEKDKGLPGVAKSIIKKLTKVRRECMRGNFGNAREKLRALIKQVNAQRGKHLTEEAYALIKFNAEFLLEKL